MGWEVMKLVQDSQSLSESSSRSEVLGQILNWECTHRYQQKHVVELGVSCLLTLPSLSGFY